MKNKTRRRMNLKIFNKQSQQIWFAILKKTIKKKENLTQEPNVKVMLSPRCTLLSSAEEENSYFHTHGVTHG